MNQHILRMYKFINKPEAKTTDKMAHSLSLEFLFLFSPSSFALFTSIQTEQDFQGFHIYPFLSERENSF
jgi:hypothetical protein